MSDILHDLHGVRVLELSADGPAIDVDRGASDVLSAAWSAGARMAAIPVARLGTEFLRLGTGQAGAFLQKFVNDRMRVVILGDTAAAAAASDALRDFIRESNRGRHVWFVADIAELRTRLAAELNA